jgi:predicted nucleic acid-binding protein
VDIVLDTNVILRVVDPSHPQYRIARKALRQVSTDHRLCVTTQNLIESWVVCTRPLSGNGLGWPPELASWVLYRIEKFVYRLPESDSVYPEWRKLVAQRGISGKRAHDARIVALMKVHSVSRILTFNGSDFSGSTGIGVVVPLLL